MESTYQYPDYGVPTGGIPRSLPVEPTAAVEDESFEQLRLDLLEDEANTASPLNTQISGDHYRLLPIQPVAYIHANNIPFIEGCIIKYATRWRSKGGIQDLQKIKHFVDLLITLEATK